MAMTTPLPTWYCSGCGRPRPKWDPKDRCECGESSVTSQPRFRVWNGPGPVVIPERPKAARPLAQVRREAGQSWYRIRNAADGETAEIWLYDEIGMWGVSAGQFVEELTALHASAITLHVNSPGGEVWDGLAIYNALRTHPATVTVRVDGAALSAASFIAQAGDRVVTARQSQWMIHDASGLCIGDAEDMTAMAEVLDQLSGMIAEIYHDRAGGGVTKWRDLMRVESWYTAEQAVEVGLADEVAPLPKREEDAAAEAMAQWDLSVFRRPPAERPAAAVPGPAPAAAGTEPEGGTVPGGQVEPPAEPEPGPAALAWPEVSTEAFRGALAAAVEIRFDPDQFRDLIGGEFHTVPATPAPARAAFPAGQPVEPQPDPEPAEKPMTLAEWFRAAVEVAANDAPAPPGRQPEPEPDPDPGPAIDSDAFRRAVREARL